MDPTKIETKETFIDDLEMGNNATGGDGDGFSLKNGTIEEFNNVKRKSVNFSSLFAKMTTTRRNRRGGRRGGRKTEWKQ